MPVRPEKANLVKYERWRKAMLFFSGVNHFAHNQHSSNNTSSNFTKRQHNRSSTAETGKHMGMQKNYLLSVGLTVITG